MRFARVDHTAIVVANLDDSLARYRQLFSVEPGDRRIVPTQQVELAFLNIGDTQLELICPTDDSSGVARFLARHGESLHHVGIAVANIRDELQRLEAEGYALIDREPRRGPHGLIAFVHPRSTGGVMFELVQRDPVQAS
jgi:methylmalonyl-CoA/ethylmalonyl-CoA epimerase